MSSRRAWMVGALTLCASVVAVLRAPLGYDYEWDAAPAIDALRAGDLGAFFAHQPQMGPLSLWLRWPAAELGTSQLAIYQAGSLVCLLAVVALCFGLARIRSVPTGPLVLLAVLLAAGPVTARALQLGHPEELLGAALCTGALLFARGGRTVAAGVTLGLALATKQWALFALLPVLMVAAAAERRRLALVALALGGGLSLLPAIVDPAAFLEMLERPVAGLSELRPGNVWSLLIGPTAEVSVGGGQTEAIGLVPGWLKAVAHPGIVLVALAVPVLWWRRGAHEPLALLALIFLLRCGLDPWNHEYYHLPFLVALGAWEVVDRRRAPVLTLLATAVLYLVFVSLAGTSGESLAADGLYVAWFVPMCAALGLECLGRVAVRPPVAAPSASQA